VDDKMKQDLAKMEKLIPINASELQRKMKPQVFVLEDILAKGNLYTLTARNNHGKSTLMAALIKAITDGGTFNGLKTVQGRILLLSGENTVDTMLKLEAINVNLDLVDIVDAPYEIKTLIDDQIKFATNEYVGVMVDSNQSYFGDGDMNGNGPGLLHFQALRRLTELDGNPFVAVLSHPTKSAKEDELIPYGAGSGINEIDTNLTLWKDGEIATFHIGKARQQRFEPIKLRLEVHTFPDRFNNFGKQVTSSKFTCISDTEAEAIEEREISTEVGVLELLNLKPDATYQHIGDAFFRKPGEMLDDPRAAAARKKQAERFIKTLINGKYLTKTKKLTRLGKELING